MGKSGLIFCKEIMSTFKGRKILTTGDIRQSIRKVVGLDERTIKKYHKALILLKYLKEIDVNRYKIIKRDKNLIEYQA